MKLGDVRLGQLNDGRLDHQLREQLLQAARAAEPTYDHIGSTLDPQRWSKPEVHTYHADIGHGAAAFDAARDALRTWVPHNGIKARVEPAGQPVEVGATVLVVLRRGPLFVVAPNRIVAVSDERSHFAFAYGTLPTHPERGEESFAIDHLDDDSVRATIRVHAVPATWAARLAGPAVRWAQRAALQRYLDAIGQHVQESLTR